MIVRDLDIRRVTVLPFEADPPLPVDPNAVLALPIPLQRLQLIRSWNRQVLEITCSVQLLQLHQCSFLNVAWKFFGILTCWATL
jgi:hypothetical protein